MKEIDVEELKKIELEILKYVADFCDKNGIKYFLWGGTLLGAIRHNGFIPWDDDIDIAMPRKDYEKFMIMFNSDKYQALSCGNNKLYMYSFGKVINTNTIKIEPVLTKMQMGIDIDIFPIDNYHPSKCTNDSIKERIQNIKYKNYAIMPYKKIYTAKDIAKNLFLFMFHIFKKSGNYYANRLNINVETYNGDYMLFSDSNINKPLIIKKEWIGEYVKHKFEDSEFNIPIGYDALLTACYGDYMTPPPIEKQITHHTNKVYYR